MSHSGVDLFMTMVALEHLKDEGRIAYRGLDPVPSQRALLTLAGDAPA